VLLFLQLCDEQGRAVENTPQSSPQERGYASYHLVHVLSGKRPGVTMLLPHRPLELPLKGSQSPVDKSLEAAAGCPERG